MDCPVHDKRCWPILYLHFPISTFNFMWNFSKVLSYKLVKILQRRQRQTPWQLSALMKNKNKSLLWPPPTLAASGKTTNIEYSCSWVLCFRQQQQQFTRMGIFHKDMPHWKKFIHIKNSPLISWLSCTFCLLSFRVTTPQHKYWGKRGQLKMYLTVILICFQ